MNKVKVVLTADANEGVVGDEVEVDEQRAKLLIRGGAAQPANKTAAKTVGAAEPSDKK